MKKIIWLFIIFMSIFMCGCQKDVIPKKELKEQMEKLNEIDFSNTSVNKFLSAYGIDDNENRIVVELYPNSKKNQKEFLRITKIDKKYIKFRKGGPYRVLNDKNKYYLVKSKIYNSVRFKPYLVLNDRTIYLSGNAIDFYIKELDKNITLKEYLTKSFQTIDDSIKSITDELELRYSLRDGGTKIYKSNGLDLTIILCNTSNGNKDIFIGEYNLEYKNDCQK